MSLLARVVAAAECAFAKCHEPRVEGALFGRACGHLNDWNAGRIVRLADGSFADTAGPQRRDARQPAWLTRARERPNGLARDLTRSAA